MIIIGNRHFHFEAVKPLEMISFLSFNEVKQQIHICDHSMIGSIELV